jgi:hypothetical protein
VRASCAGLNRIIASTDLYQWLLDEFPTEPLVAVATDDIPCRILLVADDAGG